MQLIKCLALVFCLLFINYSESQDQNVADELRVIYNKNELYGAEKMDLLQRLAYNELNDLDAALKYSNELIDIAKAVDSFHYVYEGYLNKGYTYSLRGDVDEALEAFFKSSEAAKKSDSTDEAASYIAIADVYSEMGNSDNAELYYNKGIELFRNLNDPESLASALFNSGDEYFNSKKYHLALERFKESEKLFENLNYPIGKAYTQGSIGMVYAEISDNVLAEKKINEAIIILEDLEDYNGIAEYLNYMSDIYLNRKELETAVIYAKRSLDIASRNNIKKQIYESNFKLYEIHNKLGDFESALSYHIDYKVYRDSVINLENERKAFDSRTNFEVSQKQAEVELSEQKRKNQRIVIWSTIGVLSLISLLAFNLFKSNKFVKATNKIIAHEKERSEALLLNILPEETANELKENGKVKAKKYDSVTVLFTDFKGFTSYAENLPPEKLVEAVDFYFSHFDKIMENHGIEKIKTIGDAYMCASGLNDSEKDHAHRMVKAAIDMEAFVKNTKHDEDIDTSFDIRIGISTGSVVAGVVGTKKFAYDIWGDTVNVASRMESNSEPGKINISHDTYSIVKDSFQCEFRGQIAVKNRGEMKMYFVNSVSETV